jgi:plasmid stabilization system protein ParE
MEERKLKVIYRERARLSIRNFAILIEEEGYPETADKFVKSLITFGSSLNKFPEKYALCKNPSLLNRKFRCAVFKNNYIFIYKIIRNELIILAVFNLNVGHKICMFGGN